MLLEDQMSDVDRTYVQQRFQPFRGYQHHQLSQQHYQQLQQQHLQQHNNNSNNSKQTPDLIEQDLQLLKNGVIYNSKPLNNFTNNSTPIISNNNNNSTDNNSKIGVDNNNNDKINSNIIADISNCTIADKCNAQHNTLIENQQFQIKENDKMRENINEDSMNDCISTSKPSSTLKEYNYKHKLILAKNSLIGANGFITQENPPKQGDVTQSDNSKINFNQSYDNEHQPRSNNSTPESKTQDFSPITPLETIEDQPMTSRNETNLAKTAPFSSIRNVFSKTENDVAESLNNENANDDEDDDEYNSELPDSPNQIREFGFKKERQNSFNTDNESKDDVDEVDDDDDNDVAVDRDNRKMPDLLLQHATTLNQLKSHHPLYNPYIQKAYESYKHLSDVGLNIPKRELSQDGFQSSPGHQQALKLPQHPLANLWQQYKNSSNNSADNSFDDMNININNDCKSEPISAPGQSPFANSNNKQIDGNESESSSASNKRNVFCCHICSFVGSSEEDFNSHMTQHFEHQCPHCTYSSRTEGRLKRHIKDFHSNEDSIYTGQHKVKSSAPKRTCRYCKFYTYDQVEFWVHLKKHIKPEKLLECPHCEFVTELKHHLEYHIRVHIGSKPFKCPKCNYSCVNKSMLNSHMKSHTNVYQFRCRDCNYATKYSHSLKLHLIKKKHHADVVLNSDGSLPTDGTGHFDSINRRGPPRGPRTIKKAKALDSSFALRQHLANPFKFLADPRLQFAGKSNSDDYFWSDSHRSRSPSEASTTSKDENLAAVGKSPFPPLPGMYPLPPTLPARPVPPPPSCMPMRLFDCSFCTEKFTTPLSLKCHVEETHYRDLMIFKFNQPQIQPTTFFESNQPIKKEQILSMPTKTELQDEMFTSVDNVALDLSNNSKRKVDEDKDSGHADSPSSVHSSPDSLVRKRARKGRAFKLQTEKFDDQPVDREECTDTDNINTASESGDNNEMAQKEDNKLTSPSSSSSSSDQNLKLKVDSSWHLCRHCEMAFADQMTHRLHMGYHGYFNPFQCNGCGENCVDAFDFMLHLMSKAHN